ncbi:MAG: uracil-DNA glycosylase [Asgard group archaeon]|nr:uracil-DNA glycosylase [Asgard group archaeon]
MSMLRIIKKIKDCKKCPLGNFATKPVPGEGPLNSKYMLIGQNPGKKEDETGRPFVGRSGTYLNKILRQNGLTREMFYITSVVKHASPNNRKPTKKEIEACLPYLLEQIKIIQPEIIVLMGKVAWEVPKEKKRTYIKTYHPAAAMRFPKFREKFKKDFHQLTEFIQNEN